MLQGILRKQERGILKRYKKRLFIINEDETNVRYYSAKQTGSLLGEIHIGCIIDVRPLKDDEKGHKETPYGFQITTPERAHFLFAKTIEERRYWCDGLNAKIEQIKRKKPLTHQAVSVPIQILRATDSATLSSISEPSSSPLNASTGTVESEGGRRKLARSQSFDQSMIISSLPSTPTTPSIFKCADDEMGSRKIGTNTNKFPPMSSRRSPSKTISKHPTSTISANNSPSNTQPRNNGMKSPSTHARKKSGGRIQDDISDYVKMSIWLQRQEHGQKEKNVKNDNTETTTNHGAYNIQLQRGNIIEETTRDARSLTYVA